MKILNWINEKFIFWRLFKYRNSWLNILFWKLLHRFHPEHQYNKLNTSLPPGYYDPDVQILYAVMNTFKTWYEYDLNFVNKTTDFNSDKTKQWYIEAGIDEKQGLEYYNTNKIIKAEFDKVYDWWINRYLKNIDNNDIDTEVLEEESVEMLCILMKHRSIMWYP